MSDEKGQAQTALASLVDLGNTLVQGGPDALMQKLLPQVMDQLSKVDLKNGLPQELKDGLTIETRLEELVTVGNDPCEPGGRRPCVPAAKVKLRTQVTPDQGTANPLQGSDADGLGKLLKNFGEVEGVFKKLGLTPSGSTISQDGSKTLIDHAADLLPKQAAELLKVAGSELAKSVPGLSEFLNAFHV